MQERLKELGEPVSEGEDESGQEAEGEEDDDENDDVD